MFRGECCAGAKSLVQKTYGAELRRVFDFCAEHKRNFFAGKKLSRFPQKYRTGGLVLKLFFTSLLHPIAHLNKVAVNLFYFFYLILNQLLNIIVGRFQDDQLGG